MLDKDLEIQNLNQRLDLALKHQQQLHDALVEHKADFSASESKLMKRKEQEIAAGHYLRDLDSGGSTRKFKQKLHKQTHFIELDDFEQAAKERHQNLENLD